MTAAPQVTWVHHAARVCVRPLVGTFVRPNHLTTLRLLSGLAAAAMFAFAGAAWADLAGALFVFSAFLDRADGELARLSGITSRKGHIYDLAADGIANTAVFAGIGVGLREGPLGASAITMGLSAGLGIAAIFSIVVGLEMRADPADRGKPFGGKAGFDPDDSLFLIGPIAWLGLLTPFLVAASVGAPLFAAGCLIAFRRRLFGDRET